MLNTVMALPCIFVLFSLCNARSASWRRFMQRNAQPRGGIKSIDTMSPNSPKVSDKSCSWTSFDKWPTHNVVLHTAKLTDTNQTNLNKNWFFFSLKKILDRKLRKNQEIIKYPMNWVQIHESPPENFRWSNLYNLEYYVH